MSLTRAEVARRHHRFGGRAGLGIAPLPGQAPDTIHVGHIEIIALDGQAMRAVEPRSKGRHQFRLAVAIGIAQAQDGPPPRQRQEDIAIGRHG